MTLRVQWWCRSICLALFVLLLGLTCYPPPFGWPLPENLRTDIFLRLDPLLALGLPVVVRQYIPTLVPGLLILGLACVAGRVFCRYICPMGTSLRIGGTLLVAMGGTSATSAASATSDASTAANAPRVSPRVSAFTRHIRYLLLAALLAAALTGVNLLFWASPIALITRLYATLLYPLAQLAGAEGLILGQNLFSELDMPALAYAHIGLRRFDGLVFIVLFFGLLLYLEKRRPTFWCSYLCPAGGLMHLLYIGQKRIVKRCAGCSKAAPSKPAGNLNTVLPSRRAFLAASGAGVGLAALNLSDVHSLLSSEPKGQLWSVNTIRPPGAVPEAEFQRLCVRCAQCMKACPSNGLQPVWLETGLGGMFSPVLVSRRGPCEPDCTLCTHNCPSSALRPLSLQEKQHAKIGTAVVHASRCVAYAEGKRCLVCQEVCPYGAIEMVRAPVSSAAATQKLDQAQLSTFATTAVFVPVVAPSRCIGCGYCENHCPVRIPAITVEALNALRLSSGSYQLAAQEAGLTINRKSTASPSELSPLPSGDLPPGFTD